MRRGNETHRFDPARGIYTLREPGKPTATYHADSATARAATTPLPLATIPPVCADGGHRIVVVWAHRSNFATAGAPVIIRDVVQRMNPRFRQASSDSGGTPLDMKVDCDQYGQITVKDLVIASNDKDAIRDAVTTTYGAPQGSQAVKYLVFRDDQHPPGIGGIAFPYYDTRKTASDDMTRGIPATNLNRVNSVVGIVWNPLWQTYAPLHELIHTLGGTQGNSASPAIPVAAPFSTPGGHCTDGIDLLCYDDGTSSVPYSETACDPYYWPGGDNLPLDCNFDTYFDSAPEPGEWLGRYWNVGGREDPFLTGTDYTELRAFYAHPAGLPVNAASDDDGYTWRTSQQFPGDNLAAGAAPHPVSPYANTVATFWRGRDDNLWYSWTYAGVGYGPVQLTTGGAMASEPSPLALPSGAVYVYWRGSDGTARRTTLSRVGGTVSGPTTVATGVAGTPQPILDGYGVELFWRGTDDVLYRLTPGSPPQRLLTTLPMTGDPTVATSTGRNVYAFWRSGNGTLWFWSVRGGVEYSKYALSGYGLVADPHVVHRGNGVYDVFWRARDDSLVHAWWDGSWHEPETLAPAGSMGGDPDPISREDGTLHVLFRRAGWRNVVDVWNDTYLWRTTDVGSTGAIGSDPKGVFAGFQ